MREERPFTLTKPKKPNPTINNLDLRTDRQHKVKTRKVH